MNITLPKGQPVAIIYVAILKHFVTVWFCFTKEQRSYGSISKSEFEGKKYAMHYR